MCKFHTLTPRPRKGPKNRPQNRGGHTRSSPVLSHLPRCRPQDGRTGPRDRHHRDERGRFALKPVHLLPPGEDARRQGCEKMRVSSHWAAVPVHSVSMPMLLLLSCAARSQTQNKAVAQWGVCARLCATVALAKQAPADQEPRELRRANWRVLRRRVMEPHSLSATLCAKRYCTWLGGAVGRRAAPRGRWWGRGVARARAEELTADFYWASMNVTLTDTSPSEPAGFWSFCASHQR